MDCEVEEEFGLVEGEEGGWLARNWLRGDRDGGRVVGIWDGGRLGASPLRKGKKSKAEDIMKGWKDGRFRCEEGRRKGEIYPAVLGN